MVDEYSNDDEALGTRPRATWSSGRGIELGGDIARKNHTPFQVIGYSNHERTLISNFIPYLSICLRSQHRPPHLPLQESVIHSNSHWIVHIPGRTRRHCVTSWRVPGTSCCLFVPGLMTPCDTTKIIDRHGEEEAIFFDYKPRWER